MRRRLTIIPACEAIKIQIVLARKTMKSVLPALDAVVVLALADPMNVLPVVALLAVHLGRQHRDTPMVALALSLPMTAIAVMMSGQGRKLRLMLNLDLLPPSVLAVLALQKDLPLKLKLEQI
jgi:hypothetical protein